MGPRHPQLRLLRRVALLHPAADDCQLLPVHDHLHAAHAPRRAALQRRRVDVAARCRLDDDRSMGPFADYKTHYIVPSHVAHHIFSDMPYYGAMEATPYIKAYLGKYYKEAMPEPVLGSTYLGYLRDFYVAMNQAITVGYEEGNNFMWFK